MRGGFQILKRVLILLLLGAGLAACGQGGTEIGNPNLPAGGQAPSGADGGTDAAPSLEAATPSPGPQSFLIEDSQEGGQEPGIDGTLDEPEET